MSSPLPRAFPFLGLALALLAAGCGPAEPSHDSAPRTSVHAAGQGLVVEDPPNPARPYFHDFGTIPHGERRERVVRLFNTDDAEVVIRSAQGACACTRLRSIRLLAEEGPPLEGDLASEDELLRVPPGARAELVIEIDTRKVAANHDKLAMLRVRTSSPHTPFLDFEQHVKGERPFLVRPDEIRLGDVPRSWGGAGKTTIMTGAPGTRALVLDVFGHSERIEPSLEYLFVNDEHVWTLSVVLKELQPLGPVREVVTLSTTDDSGEGDAGRLEVVVWANVVEDVVFRPGRLLFPLISAGAGGSIEGTLSSLVPGVRLALEEARVEGELAEHFAPRFAPVRSEEDGKSSEWTVTLEAAPELPPGPFHGVLRLVTDDPQHPEIAVPFSGAVRE